MSGIRSFAEPAVRFYNKCVLEPFTVEETAEYANAVFGGTTGVPSERPEPLPIATGALTLTDR
jgi:hypothetical protein